MSYTAFRETLNSKPKFIPSGEDFPISSDKDYYSSLFQYTEDHKKIFEQEGTLSGIKDTVTDKLYFDFDCKDNLEAAREDAVKLAIKLVGMGVPSEALRTTFSGCKGYTVEFNLDRNITQPQFKAAVFNLAEEYPTFDRVVNDANRVIRIPNTKHPKSGLYKIPLTEEEITSLSSDEIKLLAKVPRECHWKETLPVTLPEEFFKTEELAKVISINPSEIDFSKKAKGWSNCKWSLLNGNFTEGGRHYPIMAIIATSRSLGYPKETAYYMAKSASKLSIQKNGGSEYNKEEIWAQVEGVYSNSWNGGTFSCRDGRSNWLTKICEDLGEHKCKKTDNSNFIEVDKVFSEFATFAKDIDKNTIKTGIKTLDDGVRFRTGQMIGILGAPSSGKTALALEILENTSRTNLLSVFYSLDMSSSELFQKIASRVTGYSEQELFKILQNDKVKSEEIRKQVCEAYTNVKFCFDTGVSVEHIQTSIDEFQNLNGRKVVLLLLDYNELLSSQYSDSTANSGHNAGLLKKLTNINQICTISLLQPPKVVGDASDEIISYRSIKGSSLLEQCFSVVIGVFRPGFSPKNNSINDRYMVMNVLKNRLGRLFSLNFYWNGLRGKIDPIVDDEGEREIAEIIEAKKASRVVSSSGIF